MTSGTLGWATERGVRLGFQLSNLVLRGGGGLALVGRQEDMGRLLEVLGDQVAEGVVLLEEDKVRCIGQAWES
jgi:hypothetical protein